MNVKGFRFSLKALVKCQMVRAFFCLRLNRFASGVLGRNENRDQSSLRSTGGLGGTLHTVKLDPRSSILTQDAPALFQAAAVNLTAERPGKVSLKSLLSLSRVQLIWHMRRAMMVMARLAFLPRARCRR
jgi:hypothetical protein